MFVPHELHWIAAVLNPRTRMLKMATEVERCHAHGLVCSRITQIMEENRVDTMQSPQTSDKATLPSPPQKKFKSYTNRFDDDVTCNQINKDTTNAMRARRELDAYLELDLSKSMYSAEEHDNPLLFWKEHEVPMPNLSKLSKKIFCIPASAAAVERSFSAAGYIISQRRSNLNPSMVNDMMVVQSAAIHSKDAI